MPGPVRTTTDDTAPEPASRRHEEPIDVKHLSPAPLSSATNPSVDSSAANRSVPPSRVPLLRASRRIAVLRRVGLLLVPLSVAVLVGEASRAADKPRPLRVAAVQMRSTRDVDRNVARIRETLQKLAEDGVRVAVFPECAATGYFESAAMKAVSREKLAEVEREIAAGCQASGIHAVVGMPVREGDRLFNSAVVFGPDGRVRLRYHKIQLAEDWPVGGERLYVFDVDGVPCTVIVCHDERYPELVRLPVLAGARVVFYLSHESPVVQERKLDPYRAQIQARAVENTVFVVHANAPANPDASGSHGQSRIVGPDGNVLPDARSDRGDRPQRAQERGARPARRVVARGTEARGPRGGVRIEDRGSRIEDRGSRRREASGGREPPGSGMVERPESRRGPPTSRCRGGHADSVPHAGRAVPDAPGFAGWVERFSRRPTVIDHREPRVDARPEDRRVSRTRPTPPRPDDRRHSGAVRGTGCDDHFTESRTSPPIARTDCGT
jgi:predicted amidohydrolase